MQLPHPRTHRLAKAQSCGALPWPHTLVRVTLPAEWGPNTRESQHPAPSSLSAAQRLSGHHQAAHQSCLSDHLALPCASPALPLLLLTRPPFPSNSLSPPLCPLTQQPPLGIPRASLSTGLSRALSWLPHTLFTAHLKLTATSPGLGARGISISCFDPEN